MTLKALIFVWFAVILETALYRALPGMGWVPYLSVAVIVFTALRLGSGAGWLCGLMAGVLSSMLTELPWQGILSLGLMGFLCGRLRAWVFLESPFTSWLMPLAGLMLVEATTVFWGLPDDGTPRIWLVLQRWQHSPLLATAIAAPFVRLAFDRMIGPPETQ